MLFRSLGRAVNSAANIHNDISSVKKLRKEIFELKDRLAGTHQYATIFYSLITDINHPPCYIEWTPGGVFWTQNWEPQVFNYEPFSTAKYQDQNIGNIEANAIFLLIMDSYPNVFDSSNYTIAQLQAGTAQFRLDMKKEFYGRQLIPAVVPTYPYAQANPNNYQQY